MAQGNIGQNNVAGVLREVKELRDKTKTFDGLSEESKLVIEKYGAEINSNESLNELITFIDVELIIEKDLSIEGLLDKIDENRLLDDDSEDDGDWNKGIPEEKEEDNEDDRNNGIPDEEESVPSSEIELESKVPDRILMEELLRELDEHEKSKDKSKLLESAKKLAEKKGYAKIRDQVERLIEKKVELEGKIESELSTKQISSEEKEIVSERLSEAVAISSIAMENEKADSAEIAKVEEEIIKNVDKLLVNEDTELYKAGRVVENIIDKVNIEESKKELLVESIRDELSEISVERIASKEAEEIIQSFEELNIAKETKVKIRERIEERIVEVYRGNLIAVESSRVDRSSGQSNTVRIEDEIRQIIEESNTLGDAKQISKDITQRIEVALKEPRTITDNSGQTVVLPSLNDEIKVNTQEKAEIVGGFRKNLIVRESVEVALEAWNRGEISVEEVDGAYESARIAARTAYPDGDFVRNENKIEEKNEKGKEFSKIISGMVRSETPIEEQVKEARAAINKTGKIYNKLPIEVKALDKISSELEKNKPLAEFFERVRKFTVAKRKAEERVWRVASDVGRSVAKSLGVNITSETINNMAFIASGGLTSQAMWAIGHQIMSGALPATLEGIGAVYTSGGFMAGATQAFESLGLLNTQGGVAALSWLGKASANLNSVGARIAARSPGLAKFGSTISKPVVNGLGKGISSAARWASRVIPAVASKIAAIGGSLAQALVALPELIGGAIAAIIPIIAIVVVAVIVGIFVIALINGMQTASVVPPPTENVSCVLLEDTKENQESGQINCNQSLDEKNVPGVDRDNFFRMADQWRGGTNYARECYNDVVCRARSVGVDEAFALWVWLHESGASNYSINEVEDFGIHGQAEVPVKNFDKQIDYFLRLSHTNACPNLDFWLGWSTKYLTGGCDPDKLVGVNTGRTYLAALQQQYNWITSKPLPAQIKKNGTGESCGSGADYSDDNTSYTYVDENGATWLCKNEPGLSAPGGPIVVPDFPDWDPNTPVPEGCPNRLPVSGGRYTQGPNAPNCSHQSMSSPAIDIGIGGGSPIYATHTGVVSYGADNIYGYYIDVHGTCNGTPFFTRYAHMPANGYMVENGATVQAGERIGTVDNTGSSTGNHIHYHINGLDKSLFGQYLGITPAKLTQLWGCCGSQNGKICPSI